MRIRIVNTMDGGEIAAEMDPTDSAGDVIVFASQYWKRDRSAFIMRVGNQLDGVPFGHSRLAQRGALRDQPAADPQGG